jgi:tripartite-type tricarboxylate transporter receptor subunit TctC
LITKTPMEFVQYRGAAPLYPDLVSGRIDFSVVAYSVALPSIQAGKLKILAVDTAQRWPEFPDVPTLAETGVPTRTKVPAWFGLSAPANTPDRIVRRLNAEFLKVANDPAMNKQMVARGIRVTTTSPEAMQAMVADAIETTANLVKSLNLQMPKK